MIPRRQARRAAPRLKWAAAAAIAALAAGLFWFGGDLFGRQYEYEEDLTLALDGSATLTINGSIPALVALRGLDLDAQSSTVDRERIRAAYTGPAVRVVSVPRPWRRDGRTFVQVNLEVSDVRRLHEVPPLAWSRYELIDRDGVHVFRQTVSGSALRAGTLQKTGWRGGELVGFRVHLPSRILEHNARDIDRDEPTGIHRGNILAWEQHLSDRLDGQPVTIEVRMESESILYRTLWLFAGAFGAAVLTLVALIWWTVRSGRPGAPAPPAATA